MSDRSLIEAELQNLQKILEAKVDMCIGAGKMKMLSFANACSGALELLKAQEAQGWVSVKDRLPEVGVDVLTASKTECESYYMVDCIVNGDWWLQAGEEVLPVTHWMPLPEPPREDEA